MGTEQLTPGELVEMYRADVQKLLAYVPYFEKMSGQSALSTFNQEGISQHSISFPVYDSNLLRFVKEAEQTVFANPQYHYVYSRFHIKSAKDEMDVINKCTIQQMEVIGAILSKYVFKGRTKGSMWSEGVRNGVYLAAITKADELVHFWDKSRLV